MKEGREWLIWVVSSGVDIMCKELIGVVVVVRMKYWWFFCIMWILWMGVWEEF